MKTIPVIVITGPCGVGKTTTAFAIGELLAAKEIPHAVVDMDSLRNCFPSPQTDPFHVQLGYRNLAAVWENYRQVGTEWLILADIVEFADAGDEYRHAVPHSQIVIVRLKASREEYERRLRGRETADSLEWYLSRCAELTELMEERKIGDFVIDTNGRTSGEIAEEILSQVGTLFPLSDKQEVPQPLEVFHQFSLVPASEGEPLTIRPEYPPLSVSDDIVQYLHQAWQWIPIRNPYKNTEIHWGLNLYGQTLLRNFDAEHFALICEAWMQLFTHATEEMALQLGYTETNEEWTEEEEHSALYYFKVNREELLAQLKILADWGRQAAKGECFLLHNGV